MLHRSVYFYSLFSHLRHSYYSCVYCSLWKRLNFNEFSFFFTVRFIFEHEEKKKKKKRGEKCIRSIDSDRKGLYYFFLKMLIAEPHIYTTIFFSFLFQNCRWSIHFLLFMFDCYWQRNRKKCFNPKTLVSAFFNE